MPVRFRDNDPWMLEDRRQLELEEQERYDESVALDLYMDYLNDIDDEFENYVMNKKDEE